MDEKERMSRGEAMDKTKKEGQPEGRVRAFCCWSACCLFWRIASHTCGVGAGTLPLTELG